MLSSRLRNSFILLAVLVLSACTAAPVYNVQNAQITGHTGQNFTEEQVKTAIVNAATGLGWSMKEIAPGKLEGLIHVRSHMAMIEVTYSQATYSIQYKDSENLNYDGRNIHKNYTRWIKNIQRRMSQELYKL